MCSQNLTLVKIESETGILGCHWRSAEKFTYSRILSTTVLDDNVKCDMLQRHCQGCGIEQYPLEAPVKRSV